MSQGDSSLVFIDQAARWARLYQRELNDPFFVKQVENFRLRTKTQQQSLVIADSLRLLGNAILDDRGTKAASLTWMRSLAFARRTNDPSVIAPLMLSIAAGHYRDGTLDRATAYAQVGITAADRIHDFRTLGNAYGLLASIRKDRGESASAQSLYRRAIEIRKLSGDDRGLAADYNNMGLLARQAGDYVEARQRIRQALEINTRLGRRDLVIVNLWNLGTIESAQGSLDAADSLIGAALSIKLERPNDAQRAFLVADHARVATQRGNYDRAIADFRLAARLHEKSGETGEARSVTVELAELVAETGDIEQAMRLVGSSIPVVSVETAGGRASVEALVALARVATRLGNYHQADSIYSLSERLSRAAAFDDEVPQILQGRSILSFMHGEAATSLDLAQHAHELSVRQHDSRNAIYSTLLVANARHALGDSRYRIDMANALHQARALHDLLLEAAVRDLSGDFLLPTDAKAAEAEYRNGMRALGSLPAVDVKWQLEAGLGRSLAAQHRFDDAAVALHKSVVSIESVASGLAARENRYGFLHDKWSVYAELARVELDRRNVTGAFEVNERMRARELVETMRVRRAGAIATGATTQTATAANVSASLSDDEIMLEYLLGDSSSSVFAITRRGIAAVPLKSGRERIASLVDFSSRSLTRPRDARVLWQKPLQRLYSELISPVESAGYLRGKRRIIIVPHAEIHYASFASFISPENRFLVDSYDISYAPSAGAWLTVRPIPSPNGRVVGFAPETSRLPGSRAEMSALQSLYGDRAVIALGKDATSRAVLSRLNGSRIIHLATFGVMNRINPMYSFVRLAKDKNANDKLEVRDLQNLKLSGQMIVLSACQTAISRGIDDDVPSGEEWVGFIQAFLRSGASSVVASLWAVDDRATALLMSSFHRYLKAGYSGSAALNAAQRDLKKRSEFASPFYWAAFEINGERSE
jgi:CHAT domain-containing protein/Tfp pilus assembly protein PilF